MSSGDHPIQSLMKTAMENIKEMTNADNIIGDIVEAPDGSILIPISKVSFGFVAGGSEYDNNTKKKENQNNKNAEYPFGGGSGSGATVSPVAFIIVNRGNIRLIPVCDNTIIERIIDNFPQIIKNFNEIINIKN